MNIELKIHQRIDDGLNPPFYVNHDIDLSEDEPIPVLKSINDVQKVQERKSDYTKTITIPGTDNNNRVFSNIFNLARSLTRVDQKDAYGNLIDTPQNFNPDFDQTLKADATIYKNGTIVMSGYLQLTNIIILDENQFKYEIILIGRTANLFQDIAELKMNQIDLSFYDHTWNYVNVVASWTNPVGDGYVYGLIDYGLTSDYENYYIDYLFPQIYVKTLIDKIFSAANYRYSSAFFNTDRFKRLVVPFSGKSYGINGQEVLDRTFEANRTTTGSSHPIPYLAITSPGKDVVTFNNVVIQSNPSGYNNSTYEFTVPTNGRYVFTAIINATVTCNTAGQFNLFSLISCNGSPIAVQILYSNVVAASQVINIADNYSSASSVYSAGDVIKVELWQDNNVVPGGLVATADIEYLSGCEFYDTPSALFSEGAPVQLSESLPADINQTDFLSSIIKMFNLYVVPDPDDDRKLIIEPYEDFFTDELVDLTEYVDRNSEIKVMPMGALEFKSYNYAYKEDKDYLNILHQESFKDTYGIRKFKILNDFVKAEYTTDIIFSPTPLTEFNNSDRILSQIVFKNGTTYTQGKTNLRILYYGGLINCTPSWTLKSRTGSNYTETSYPYVGHLDSPVNPAFDLCFGIPTQLQYPADAYTSNNLFNLYHQKNIKEIIDPDSKIVEMKLRLNEVHQLNLSFRKFYIIDELYYRIYQVEYDANSIDLTTIKFLKLTNAPAFVGAQFAVNGGSGGLPIEQGGGDAQMMPGYQEPIQRNGNNYQATSDVIPFGNDNAIEGDSIITNSNDNILQADGLTVLGGGGNRVAFDNCTLIGCSGFVPTFDGENAVNNISMPIYKAVNLTVYDVSALNISPYELVPKKTGWYTEIVDCYATIYFGYTTDAPVAYVNRTMHLRYKDSEVEIFNINESITSASTLKRVKAEQVDFTQLDEAVCLFTNSGLGDTGNGRWLIEIHYRYVLKLL